MLPRQLLLIAVLFFFDVSAVFSVELNEFLLDKERGWFWYEILPEPPEDPEIKPLPPPPTDETVVRMKPEPNKPPPPLSVDWFNANYPQILHQAIDNPTPENVATYRYATRVMLDKASNFAHEFKRQALLDPLLDESNRYPFSSAARGSFQNFTNEQRRKAIGEIAAKAGLWVFLDEKCSFCSVQYPVIARMARERGFIVTYITPDGRRPEWIDAQDEVVMDMGQSLVLQIGIRPATVLVIPPKDFTVLTQGMLSQDLLEERILVAGDAAGLIADEDRKNAFPNERGLLTPEDIQRAGEAMEHNPDDLTPTVQDLIKDRY